MWSLEMVAEMLVGGMEECVEIMESPRQGSAHDGVAF